MNQNKRAKDTGSLVRDIFIEHPDWNARQIYDRYLILIGDANMAVTLNAVQKHVEKAKAIYNSPEVQGLEALWHIGSLVEYPLPSDAIPYAFAVKYWAEKRKYLPVTIGQAIWISRLYVFTGNMEKLKPKIRDNAIGWLYHWSRIYRLEEIKSTLVGNLKYDTAVLDNLLMERVRFVQAGDSHLAFFNDQSFYLATKDKKLIQQMEKMKKDGKEQ